MLWANAAVVHGWCIFEEGQLAPGITLVEQAYEVGTQAGSLLIQFLAAWNRSNSAVMLDDPRASLESCRRALDDPRIAAGAGIGAHPHILGSTCAPRARTARRASARSLRHTRSPMCDLQPISRSRMNGASQTRWKNPGLVGLATGDHWSEGFSMSSFFDCFDADVQRSELQRCRTVTDWAQPATPSSSKYSPEREPRLPPCSLATPRSSAADLDRCRALTGDGQDWGFLPGRIDFAEAVMHGSAGNDTNATEYARTRPRRLASQRPRMAPGTSAATACPLRTSERGASRSNPANPSCAAALGRPALLVAHRRLIQLDRHDEARFAVGRHPSRPPQRSARHHSTPARKRRASPKCR